MRLIVLLSLSLVAAFVQAHHEANEQIAHSHLPFNLSALEASGVLLVVGLLVSVVYSRIKKTREH